MQQMDEIIDWEISLELLLKICKLKGVIVSKFLKNRLPQDSILGSIFIYSNQSTIIRIDANFPDDVSYNRSFTHRTSWEPVTLELLIPYVYFFDFLNMLFCATNKYLLRWFNFSFEIISPQ